MTEWIWYAPGVLGYPKKSFCVVLFACEAAKKEGKQERQQYQQDSLGGAIGNNMNNSFIRLLKYK